MFGHGIGTVKLDFKFEYTQEQSQKIVTEYAITFALGCNVVDINIYKACLN